MLRGSQLPLGGSFVKSSFSVSVLRLRSNNRLRTVNQISIRSCFNATAKAKSATAQDERLRFSYWFKNVFRKQHVQPAAGSGPHSRADSERSIAGHSAPPVRFRQLLPLARPEAKPLAIAFVALVVTSSTNLLLPWGVGHVLDLCTGPHADPAALRQLATALFGVFAVGSLAAYVRAYALRMAGERMAVRLRASLLARVLARELAFFDQARTGELLSRLSGDVALVSAALTDNIATGLRRSLEGVLGLALLLYLSPQLTAVMLACVPLLAVGAVVCGRYVRFLSTELQAAQARASELAAERLAQIRTVRAFGREPAETLAYSERLEQALSLARRAAVASAGFYAVLGLAVNAALLGGLAVGAQLVLAGSMTVGQLTSFLLYSIYVGGALSGMAGLYADLMRALGASARVLELLEARPPATAMGGTVRLPALRGDLSFELVHFAYPTRPDAEVLRGLSVAVPAGGVLAVVGASGSGKSTLAQLLLGFYRPQKGRVTIDGQDVAELDHTWWREQIGVVSQEPVLFAASIEDNIRYGNPRATDDQVRQAAELANAHEFITQFPNGYKTLVGEHGSQLSGGQKQRIAIARALVRQPRLLVLDEATSALDAHSELRVQEALVRSTKGRTALVIAHRLSTIRAANRIAVIQNGVCVEVGTYAELLASDGAFTKLVQHQLHGNIE